jgi:hypothetical protein
MLISQTDRQTDGQTHQNYSSEPHKTFYGQTDRRTDNPKLNLYLKKNYFFSLLTVHLKGINYFLGIKFS